MGCLGPVLGCVGPVLCLSWPVLCLDLCCCAAADRRCHLRRCRDATGANLNFFFSFEVAVALTGCPVRATAKDRSWNRNAGSHRTGFKSFCDFDLLILTKMQMTGSCHLIFTCDFRTKMKMTGSCHLFFEPKCRLGIFFERQRS